MKRDTKLGYGFLFFGAGLPYLVDKLVSPGAGIVCATICLVVGIGFLAWGHFHPEPGEERRRMGALATIATFTLIAAFVGAIVGSIVVLWNKKHSAGKAATVSEPAPAAHIIGTRPEDKPEPPKAPPAAVAKRTEDKQSPPDPTPSSHPTRVIGAGPTADEIAEAIKQRGGLGTTPDYGNLAERANNLADSIMQELYLHGYSPQGAKLHGVTPLMERPTAPDDLKKWEDNLSLSFKTLYLRRAIAIRDEFAAHNYREDSLDSNLDLFESIARSGRDFPIATSTQQEVARGLQHLASQLPGQSLPKLPY